MNLYKNILEHINIKNGKTEIKYKYLNTNTETIFTYKYKFKIIIIIIAKNDIYKKENPALIKIKNIFLIIEVCNNQEIHNKIEYSDLVNILEKKILI